MKYWMMTLQQNKEIETVVSTLSPEEFLILSESQKTSTKTDQKFQIHVIWSKRIKKKKHFDRIKQYRLTFE